MSTPPVQTHLLGATLEEFASCCVQHKLPLYRARQVFDWVYRHGANDFEAMSNLPKALRQQFAEQWVIGTAREIRRREAKDGTIKLLLAWPDGAGSECVLIPESRRRTACLSSQVGCPVRCAFCASGLSGLQRQLSAGQIVEQALCIRRLGPATDKPGESEALKNIVLMGLGEPLANYPNVLKAIRIINAEWGLNVGARKITLSTVGLPAQIRKLAGEDLPINLAISLHAATDELRRELIPWAKNTPLDEIVEAARYYFETTGREVTVEYLLLGGVNDKIEQANRLVTLCRRMRCNVNLIRYNPVPDREFARPSSFAAHRFAQRLRGRGVNAHIRRSRGLDIEAACGQLRRSAEASN